MLYGHIRSKLLAFRHSLSILFPYTPHCTVAETVVKNASRLFLAGVLLGKVGRHFLFLTTHIVTPGAKLHKLLLLETAQDLRGCKQREGLPTQAENDTPLAKRFPPGQIDNSLITLSF